MTDNKPGPVFNMGELITYRQVSKEKKLAAFFFYTRVGYSAFDTKGKQNKIRKAGYEKPWILV